MLNLSQATDRIFLYNKLLSCLKAGKQVLKEVTERIWFLFRRFLEYQHNVGVKMKLRDDSSTDWATAAVIALTSNVTLLVNSECYQSTRFAKCNAGTIANSALINTQIHTGKCLYRYLATVYICSGIVSYTHKK